VSRLEPQLLLLLLLPVLPVVVLLLLPVLPVVVLVVLYQGARDRELETRVSSPLCPCRVLWWW
jgi:hypothetical protein